MKNSSRISIILISALLVGSLYLTGEVSNPTLATGSVDTTVEPGDTYWYNVSRFPSFNQLLDLGNPGFDENNSLSVTGGLEGSMIYAKVIDQNQENLSYWDGSQEVSDFVPTLDLSVGLITGQDLYLEALVDGNTSTATLPKGMALPIPFVFGSATMLNVSSVPDMFLPLPLVLNDNFILHETIANQLASQLGGLVVTNDNSQFKVDATDVGIDPNNTILLNGRVVYQKPSGLLQEINFDVYNSTSSTTILDIDIDLVREEHVSLNLNIGDKFEIMIDDAGFDYTTEGDATTTDQILSEVQGNMTQAIGQQYFEFEVMDIDGLYYSVQGSMFNDTNPRIPIPTNENNFTDLWFVGFGRYGLGMPIPNENPTSTVKEYFHDYYDENGTYQSYSTWENVATRDRALAGPVVTPDFEIYTAWDKTMSFVTQLAQESGIELLSTLEAVSNDMVRIYSSVSEDPSISATYSGAQAADGSYGWNLNVGIDMGVWNNDTYTNLEYRYNGTGYEYQNVTYTSITQVDVIGAVNMNVGYSDRGRLESMSVGSDLSLEITEWNATQQTSWGKLSVSNFRFGLSTIFTPIVPDTTTTMTTTETSSTSSSTDISSSTGTSSTTSDSSTSTSSTTTTSSDIPPTSTTSDTSTTPVDTNSSLTTTTDQTSTGNNSDSVTPEVNLPGFELISTTLALMTMIGIVTRIAKKRKN